MEASKKEYGMTTVYMRHEGNTSEMRADIPVSCAAMVLREKASDYMRHGWIVKHDQDARTLVVASGNPLQSGAEFWY